MSASICSDKHIASVVIATIPEELRQTYADEIKKQNIRSVNYRYLREIVLKVSFDLAPGGEWSI